MQPHTCQGQPRVAPGPADMVLPEFLASRLRLLPRALIQRHRAFVRRRQTGDGGFRGRQGGADLYYSVFAARVLAMAGDAPADVWCRLAHFTTRYGPRATALTDIAAAVELRCVVLQAIGFDPLAAADENWAAHLRARLACYCLPAGYSRVAGGPLSTYGAFLGAAAEQHLGTVRSHPQSIWPAITSQQRQDGGFAESAEAHDSGTNPTAAAVSLWADGPGGTTIRTAGAVAFLTRMQAEDGGLRAHAAAPAGDLLSTCTGLLALWRLGAVGRLRLGAAARFVRGLEMSEGGFRGTALDSEADVEYTYYGLASLAVLADAASQVTRA